MTAANVVNVANPANTNNPTRHKTCHFGRCLSCNFKLPDHRYRLYCFQLTHFEFKFKMLSAAVCQWHFLMFFFHTLCPPSDMLRPSCAQKPKQVPWFLSQLCRISLNFDSDLGLSRICYNNCKPLFHVESLLIFKLNLDYFIRFLLSIFSRIHSEFKLVTIKSDFLSLKKLKFILIRQDKCQAFLFLWGIP